MKALPFTIPVVPDRTVIVQEDRIPQFYPYLHRHKEAQLTWIIKGAGTLIVDNSMHLFKPGDIFMIAPNQPHVFKGNTEELKPETTEIHTLSVFYDPKGALSALLQLPEMNRLDAFLKLYSSGFQVPKCFLSYVSGKILKLKVADDLDRLLRFMQLLRAFCRMDPKPEPLSTAPRNEFTDGDGLRMGNIYNYVLQHYQQELTLEQVADAAHLTPQAFCRYFKKHTGVTFVTFLNELRINEACKQLINGSFDHISQVAYHCGFNSITNFNRVFKSVKGASPKGYLTQYFKTVH